MKTVVRGLREGGLFGRIFVLAMITFLIAVLGLISFSWQLIREDAQRSLADRLVLAETIAGRLDDYLRQTVNMALVTVEMSDIDPAHRSQADNKRLARQTRSHLGSIAYYVVVLDMEHRVLATDPVVPEALSYDWGEAKCVEAVLSSGRPVITRSFVLGTPTPTVAMVVPVLDPHGRLSGALFIALNLNDAGFTDLIDPVQLGETGYVEVVDSSAVVLGATRPELRWQTDDHNGAFSGLVQNSEPWVGTCHSCHAGADGNQLKRSDVIAFAPMRVGKWGVAIRQSEDEVFANSAILRRRTLAFVALSAGLVALAAWILARQIARPLQDLTQSCQVIASGNLEEPIYPAGVAEQRTLAVAFDGMRNRLKASQDEVRAGQAELEERVRQRTVELVESKQQLISANRELTALHAVEEALRCSLDVGGSLSAAIRAVVASTSVSRAAVWLRDHSTPRLTLAACWPPCASCRSRCLDTGCKCMLLSRPVNGNNGNSLAFCELVGGCTGDCQQHLAPGEGVSCLPLMVKGEQKGIMVVHYEDGNASAERDRDLLISIGHQIGVAAENALLFRDLQEKEELRGRLLGRVISAQEEERRRIARELHDETCQAITALSVGIETAMMAPASTPQEVKSRLTSLKKMTAGMLEEIQRMIMDLRPSLLDDLGLLSAIDWYAEARLKSQDVEVEWEVIGDERRLPADLETVVFRLAQEAISNAARHAAARRVSLRVEYEARQLVLVVADDGTGFDTQSMLLDPSATGAYGLAGMQERVSLLGGSLTIESTPGTGSVVRVQIPLIEMNGESHEEDQGITRR